MNSVENVYIIKFENQPVIQKISHTNFKNVLNDNEIEKVVNLYSKGKLIYNNKAIRLENIERNGTLLKISLVNFYDFITSNMVNMNRNKLLEIANDVEYQLLEKVYNNINSNSIENYMDVLNNQHLANVIAMSVLVKDGNGNYGLVQRTSTVAVGSDFMGVTCTGSLDIEDFQSENPMIHCVKRELKEELNLIPDEIMIHGIVISKTKLQPIIIVNYKIEKSFQEIFSNMKKASDYSVEVYNFYAVPYHQLESFISNEKLTDAAQYQIQMEMNRSQQSKDSVNKIDYKL